MGNKKHRPASQVCPGCNTDRPINLFLASGTSYRRLCIQCHTIKLKVGRYNLTLEQYQAMVEVQDYSCAICSAKWVTLCIDHDHSCCPPEGKRTNISCGNCVRGLLCVSCNSRLAIIEGGDWISQARLYLERTSLARV